MKRLLQLLMIMIISIVLVLSLTACATDTDNGGDTDVDTDVDDEDIVDSNTPVVLTDAEVGALMDSAVVGLVNKFTGDDVHFSMDSSVLLVVTVAGDTFNINLDVHFAMSAQFDEDIEIGAMLTVGFIDVSETLLVAMDLTNEDGAVVKGMDFYYIEGLLYARATFTDQSSDSQVMEVYLEEMLVEMFEGTDVCNPIDYLLASVLGEDVALTTDNLPLVQSALADMLDALIEEATAAEGSAAPLADEDVVDEDQLIIDTLLDFVGNVFSGDNLTYTLTNGSQLAITFDSEAFLDNLLVQLGVANDSLIGTMYEDILYGYLDIMTPELLSFAVDMGLADNIFDYIELSATYYNDSLVLGPADDEYTVGKLDISLVASVSMSFDKVTIALPDDYPVLG